MTLIYSLLVATALAGGAVAQKLAGQQPAPQGPRQMYGISPLPYGPFDGGTAAYGINNKGQVTGYGVFAATNEFHAFIYTNGTYQDEGLMGYQGTAAVAINDSDQLAVDGEGYGTQAVLWSNGKAKSVGSIDGGFTYAYGMNNLGDVVGKGQNGDGGWVGFAYLNKVFTDLTPYGMYYGAAINDSRQIAGSTGYYWVYGGYGHSAYHGAILANGVVTEVGNLTGDPRTNTEAIAINNLGQVVGYSYAPDGHDHAFLYSNGHIQDLGTLVGYDAKADAVNNHSLVIGNLYYWTGANEGAFLVPPGGQMVLLSDILDASGAGWSGLVAVGVNDSGWIVGNGVWNGNQYAFIAKPSKATVIPSGHPH